MKAEFLSRGNLSVREILRSCKETMLTSGDVLYVSNHYLDESRPQREDQPFQMLVSSAGRKHLDSGSNILTLADATLFVPPGVRNYSYSEGQSRVTREQLISGSDIEEVSVKRFLSWAPETGLAQFRAIRALVREGVVCVRPLLATRWLLISGWVQGKPGQSPSLEFLEYKNALMEIVRKLKTEGSWESNWELDPREDDFFVRDLEAVSPLDRFVAIDPLLVNED